MGFLADLAFKCWVRSLEHKHDNLLIVEAAMITKRQILAQSMKQVRECQRRLFAIRNEMKLRGMTPRDWHKLTPRFRIHPDS